MTGIPYMGSKRKLAKRISTHIIDNNPNTKYIYDLFGGGGAISFEFLNWIDRGDKLFKISNIEKVVYNEIDTAICELLRKIRDDGVTSDFYHWVDRETFQKQAKGTDWKAGLIKTCWSFGNNGKGYLYGKHIEADKKLLHDVIVNKDYKSLEEFNKKYDVDISDKSLNINNLQERKTAVSRKLKKINCNDRGIEHIQRIEHIERLQHIEGLQHLEKLQISNKSYNDVDIITPPEQTIIYLDPPYENTGKYQNDIDHAKLWDWARNSKYKIYISSYDAPFRIVKSFAHRSILAASANNAVTEKLFCNREEP